MYFSYSLYLYHHGTSRVWCYKHFSYYTLTVTKYCNEYFDSIINFSFLGIPYFCDIPHRVRAGGGGGGGGERVSPFLNGRYRETLIIAAEQVK